MLLNSYVPISATKHNHLKNTLNFSRPGLEGKLYSEAADFVVSLTSMPPFDKFDKRTNPDRRPDIPPLNLDAKTKTTIRAKIDSLKSKAHTKIVMSDDQFTKLSEQLAAMSARFDDVDRRFDDVDRRFDDVDRRFDDVDRRFDAQGKQIANLAEATDKRFGTMDEAFAKLYGYMQNEFDKIHAELETKASKTQVDSLVDLADTIIANQETDQQERLAMNRQLDRHEAWIEKVSTKLKVSYDPTV